MKKTSFAKRTMALLLAMVLVVGIAPAIHLTEVHAANEEPVVVIAGSDFQNEDGDAAGAAQVKTLLNAIKKDYSKADGFLFAGDYNYPSCESPVLSMTGKRELKKAVQSIYGTKMDEVYVQGNHDPDVLVSNGTLAPSGDNDTDHYGVFVINEKDYDWGGDDPGATEDISYKLSGYLDEKVAEGYSKPIFVVSHIPLHFSMRTYRENEGDATYAYMIFDELNAAGAAGLNIIFLFGHDHSGGWDDYLGGGAIYLTKGDKINICQGNQQKFDVETLNFTYMNAGYVTYYREVSPGADTTLTMTVFEITGNQVVIKRYSEKGLHNLKSKGVSNPTYNEASIYRPDTKVYPSPQVITLRTKADTTALEVAISIAEEIKDADYTQESYAVLQNALMAAKTILAKETATQDEVDAAVKTLNAAMNALKEKPQTNKNELSKAIAEAEALDEDAYTAETYAVVADALKTAKAVMQDDDATQEEADTAATALSEAIKALKEKPAATDPTNPTEKPTEPTEKPTEPTEKPTEPTEKPTEPTEVTDPTDPTEAPTDPADEPTDPVEPTDPIDEPTDPVDEPTTPENDGTQAPENDGTQAPTNAPATDKDAEKDSNGMNPIVIVVIVVAVLAAAGGAVLIIKKKK